MPSDSHPPFETPKGRPPGSVEERSALGVKNKFQPTKINWWHERLIDWMLTNPHLSIKDAAVAFNVTPSYLYMLKNSDLFLDAWRVRSQEHSAIVTGTIKDKAFAVAEMALDNLATKVEEQVKNGVMNVRDSLEIIDVTMRRFGYGEGKAQAGASGAPQVTINLGLLSPDQIAAARAKLRASPSVEEAEVVVPAAPRRSGSADDPSEAA